MADQLPINTATATVKVVVDRADYDALKKEMEADFADFKEKFAGIFKVQFDSILAPVAEMIAKLDRLTPNTQSTQSEPRQRTEVSPDQTLAKLTSIERTVEDLAKDVKDIAEVMTTTN